jgi:hypothetical protein
MQGGGAAGGTEAMGTGSAREAREAALVTGRVRVAGPVEGMGVARVVCAGEVGVSLQVPPSRPLGRAWYYRAWFSLS